MRERLAEEEIGVLPEAQGERVGRMVDEDVLPGERRLERPPGGQGLGGGQMAPFAHGRAPIAASAAASALVTSGMIAAKAADHEQRGDRDAAQREAGSRRPPP